MIYILACVLARDGEGFSNIQNSQHVRSQCT